jgi:hypothetical protein
MKNYIVTLAALLAGLAGFALGAPEPFPVIEYHGKKPADLVELSPALGNAHAMQIIAIDNWRGWKSVYFVFGQDSYLMTLRFESVEPVPEADALKIVTDVLGVQLPAKGSNEELMGLWRKTFKVKTKIQTVNLCYLPGKRGGPIETIEVNFDLTKK